ncbi:MAG: NAD(+) synthase [Candidatus Polarisedimenticolaceae bacterium]|nr:NAD(+) synthase [Candidatus Polarisedimenticolaceae bacterium]
MQAAKIIDHITGWLDSYVERSGVNGFVIGVSGGIDSAVTSMLGARTGRPLLCVEMPIHQHSSQVTRAQRHIECLKREFPNVSSVEVSLTNVFDSLVSAFSADAERESHDMPLVNTRARLRMTTLYYYAAHHGHLVLGTGNQVEDFGIGFYTKYGDGGVDLSPIADLNKTEVFALGRELGVSEEILQAAPTDGLWDDDRTDEDQIGASYPELEWAMGFNGDAAGLDARQKEVLAIYRRLNRANQHKMEPIPVCTIDKSLKALPNNRP